MTVALKRLCWLIMLALVLAACGGDSVQPPPTGEPVIIPETTKVADASTRAALSVYDPDAGIMRFTQSTPLLQNLRPDDVLVSEPSAAAPAGYLRKVKTIRQEGGEVVLETTQANLTDAITQGGLKEEGDFTASDLVATEVFLQGVTAEAIPVSEGLEPQVGVGDNYRFRIGFDEVALNLGEGDVRVQIKLQGELYFNAGWGVDLGIKPCFDIPPVCVTHFEAKIGMEEWLKVELSGEASASLTKEIRVANYYFKPLVFFVGPVPVVVVPSIEVFVGASGEIRLNFRYGIAQTAQALLGARWTPNGGWRDLTGFGLKLEGHDQFTLNATMNARAYAKALASLKLYDMAGPAMSFVLGAELDGAIPRNPTWIARGFMEGNLAFVVGLPIIGTLKEYSTTLFRETIELSRAPNQPPRFSNITSGTTRVDMGVPVYIGPHSGFVRGYFNIVDPEGDPITYSVSSDRDGAISIPGNYTFTTPGVRILTVRATDSRGASSSITLRFEAVNAPPVIFTAVGSNQVPQTVEYYISARAYDPNSGDLSCNRLSWNVTAPDTLTQVPTGGGGCAAVVIFGEQGSRTVRLTATDPLGATASKTLTVFVSSPPPNPAPTINVFSIGAVRRPRDPLCLLDVCEVPEGARLLRQNNLGVPESPYYEPPLYLFATATDPNGDPLTIRWFCEGGGQQATVTDRGDGSFSCNPTGFAPANGGTVYVRVEVSDGTTTVNRVRSFEVGPLGPR